MARSDVLFLSPIVDPFGVAIAVALFGGFIAGRYLGRILAGDLSGGSDASSPTTCDEARAEFADAQADLRELERQRTDIQGKRQTARNLAVAASAAAAGLVALIVIATLGGVIPASAALAALLVTALAAASTAWGVVYELDQQLEELSDLIDAANRRLTTATDLMNQLCSSTTTGPGSTPSTGPGGIAIA